MLRYVKKRKAQEKPVVDPALTPNELESQDQDLMPSPVEERGMDYCSGNREKQLPTLAVMPVAPNGKG